MVFSIRSADTYARLHGTPALRVAVSEICSTLCPEVDLSSRDQYVWARKALRKHPSLSDGDLFDFPAWIDHDILDFWRDNYNIFLDPPDLPFD